jgi:predicted phosphodiesterase
MSIFLYSDMHVNHRNSEYMKYLDATLCGMCAKIEELKPDIVICLGDWLDTFGTIETVDLLWVDKAIGEINGVFSGEHIILVGNHDIASEGCTVLDLFSVHNRVVTRATYTHDMIFIPFTKDIQQASILFSADAKYAFAHLDFVGAKFNASTTSKEGCSIEDISLRCPNLKIFNGHYHSPNTIGNIYFVGSPLVKDFKDLGSPTRGFTFIRDNGDIVFIPNPHTYSVVEATVHSTDEFKSLLEGLGDLSKVKAKIYAPVEIVKDISSVRDAFMSLGVYRIDDGKDSIDKHPTITLVSKSEDIVKSGVESAPNEYDKVLLKGMGEVAFK